MPDCILVYLFILTGLTFNAYTTAAWTWINAAATQAEFYMGCADIKIVGKVGGSTLPPEIANVAPRLANMPGYPYYRAPGDQFGNTKSNGPNPSEVDANSKSLTGGADTGFQPMYSKRKRDRSHHRRLGVFAN
ncbi:hypothetical protein CPB97_000665 [Podila verticillata]|nr:hypothetical protein CPB97_000665 [Podila verticillata]